MLKTKKIEWRVPTFPRADVAPDVSDVEDVQNVLLPSEGYNARHEGQARPASEVQTEAVCPPGLLDLGRQVAQGQGRQVVPTERANTRHLFQLIQH